MSDISTLLQEAKPLYFKRKRQRRRFRIAAGVIGCLMFGVVLSGIPSYHTTVSNSDFDVFYAYLYDDVAYNVMMNDNGTIDTNGLLLSEGYDMAQVY